MNPIQKKPTGLTKDTGWQIGLRRTLSIPAPVLWDWMLSPDGITVWLGQIVDFQMEPGTGYQLVDGTVGEIRVYKPGSHWRMTRLPSGGDYPRPSVMQIRILESGEKSTLAFHEEHLPNQEERSTRRQFYLGVVEEIKERLTAA